MNLKRKIFNFILEQKQRWKFSPTRSQICQVFGGMSDDVNLHLAQLEREGLVLFCEDGDLILLAETFQPVPEIGLRQGAFTESPVSKNKVVTGTIRLDLRGIGLSMDDDYFSVLVPDDSMSDAGFIQGDIAIVAEQGPVRGDVVVLEVAGRYLLRRYVCLSGIPHFLAENHLRPELTPAYEFTPSGVVWCVIRPEPSRTRLTQMKVNAVNYQRDGALVLQTKSWINRKDVGVNRHKTRSQIPKSVSCSTGKKKTASKEPKLSKLHGPGYHMPELPPKMGLNDKASHAYPAKREKLICDEQPARKYNERCSREADEFPERSDP